ncbi:Golgi-specific brefeldin A-resistance guanine nucleotide exchange factor 1 isoform X2 [Daktulosphaira vitifoliae]|uniref:Golgi-specific brefeldin A-resistance guanine nucleotide exchange factor 1 isoform X2 n=1 Tax=Daktulosphaira vitifoliae TaxID=58002 RepID=UPI0021A9EE55|nr:Golgi-specific brefeldin A-resistance guanine nucleotide exchange factor 1 isoform X2 [Daktulosphaira vitifoliae]
MFAANGLYIVQGELLTLISALKRDLNSYQDEERYAPCKRLFKLRDAMNQVEDLMSLNFDNVIEPFLEVIRCEEITGPVTSLALMSIYKFVKYGLIKQCIPEEKLLVTVENIASAITHTRFIGTDKTSDAIVLMKTLQILYCLIMSPEGEYLPNESVCEIMMRCFRFCFEVRLGEFVRSYAEFCLKDIIQLLFLRLVTLDKEQGNYPKKLGLNMKSYGDSLKEHGKINENPSTDKIIVKQSDNSSLPQNNIPFNEEITDSTCENVNDLTIESQDNDHSTIEDGLSSLNKEEISATSNNKEYINGQGVRFTTQVPMIYKKVPYNTGCVVELLKFLVDACDPHDQQNTEVMIGVGLNLLVIAFEVGAHAIRSHTNLHSFIKDQLCRNMISLLSYEKMSIFSSSLKLAFLVFESMRQELKFQLEYFLSNLMNIIVNENSKIPYGKRELALKCIVKLWKIPGLVTELYLNYDCGLYCSDLYDDITKLLSKNVIPLNDIYSTHLLSMDALLAVVDSIERHCHNRTQFTQKSENSSTYDMSDDQKYEIETQIEKWSTDITMNIPSHEELMAIKRKKKLLSSGTEKFNTKPKKGIEFLQEHGLLSIPLIPAEIATFLKENPLLDKKMIGEYISNKVNVEILNSFINSFDLSGTRIDEALRMYLEAFRLPGESPLISFVLEPFTEYWHKCNGEPFANAECAFLLAYAIIMLNVDQHNQNVRRIDQPMTPEAFKRNLKKLNGGEDFDQTMLEEIYKDIKTNEIVMPAEQSGTVLENYLWKVLLRRAVGKDGTYVQAPSGVFDHALFSICWGPTLTALSSIFDKSNHQTIYTRTVFGLRKCAFICAHYGMCAEFDSLIMSLCKFTNLQNNPDCPENIKILFGSNPKAQLAIRTLFSVTHMYGDIIREGWYSLFDIILQLYKCNLLPTILVESEDFLELSGKISLIRETVPPGSQKSDAGIFSSLYSYIASGGEPTYHKIQTPNEAELIEAAKTCISECRLESLITESKFLTIESLEALVRALLGIFYNADSVLILGSRENENSACFLLEMLLKIVLQNRDRVNTVWDPIKQHLYNLLTSAIKNKHKFLLERTVVGLMRLASRLMRREEISTMILQSLSMLLLLDTNSLQIVGKQIAFGMYELLKMCAANIHTKDDWGLIFTILEYVGAGVVISNNHPDNNSDHEPISISDNNDDSGLDVKSVNNIFSPSSSSLDNCDVGWLKVEQNKGVLETRTENTMFTLHNPFSFVKCCECLAFLVRNIAHITPYNFAKCVSVIMNFARASLQTREKNMRQKNMKSKKKTNQVLNKIKNSSPYDADDSDSEDIPSSYSQVSIQLLDLMHTLYTSTADIYRCWAEENPDMELMSLWNHGWCPLLQGIASLCCDCRRDVRMSAVTYLQRALLMHDLATLNGDEWEACFRKVLFPLMNRLLECGKDIDPSGLDETKMRSATLLSKVFLHHLVQLQSLSSFVDLWITLLELMHKFMISDNSDTLNEAIPETLKNMLLVMLNGKANSKEELHSKKVFWDATWVKVNTFLPNMAKDLSHYHNRQQDSEAQNVSNSVNFGLSDTIPQILGNSNVSNYQSPNTLDISQTNIIPHMSTSLHSKVNQSFNSHATIVTSNFINNSHYTGDDQNDELIAVITTVPISQPYIPLIKENSNGIEKLTQSDNNQNSSDN